MLVGEEVKDVGVMKDEELKIEEIEASHTSGYLPLLCMFFFLTATLIFLSVVLCLSVYRSSVLCISSKERRDLAQFGGQGLLAGSINKKQTDLKEEFGDEREDGDERYGGDKEEDGHTDVDEEEEDNDDVCMHGSECYVVFILFMFAYA